MNKIGYDKWRDYDAEDIDTVLRAAHAGDGHDQVDTRQRSSRRAPIGESSTS